MQTEAVDVNEHNVRLLQLLYAEHKQNRMTKNNSRAK